MTYSIVARDPQTGEMGVASQSHYFALGRVVTFAQAGVGVVTTQSFVEPSYGPDGLALMADGTPAQPALDALVGQDADRELRQIAFLDSSGATAMFTGARCVPAKAQLAGDNVTVLGNMLANDDVVPAMLDAFTSTAGPLADRILAALDAAEAAGGDARGRMSASLVVVAGEAGARPWSNRVIDVRVDDHPTPLVELRRLVELSRAHTIFGNSVFTPGLLSTTAPTSGDALAAAESALDVAQAVIGADLEPTFWKGVLKVRAGDLAGGAVLLNQAVASRPQYRNFVDGLQSVGILPHGAKELLDA
jgi:uncharacterized Ntn-hydrolase superfamily protein